MEVLFVSHKHPPTTGGMEKQSYELVNNMRSLCKVHKLIYQGIGNKFIFFCKLKREIRKICAKHPEISVIHFNDGLIATYYLLFSLKTLSPKIKYAVTLHGLDVVYPSWVYSKILFPRLNRFDVILPVSNATAEEAMRLGINQHKIVVIPNGVDEHIAQHKFSLNFHDDFQRKHHIDLRDKHILVAMGRPVKRKGFSWFIEQVLPMLDNNYVVLLIGPFHWKKTRLEKFLSFLPPFIREKIALFLGFPTDEPLLRRLLSTPSIRKRVKQLGRLPFPEVLDVLHHARAFIMPNICVKGDMEGFGLVCLEASLCGTAVFAAATGGIPDAVVDAKNGYLVQAGNEEEWVEKLNKWIKDPAFKEKGRTFKEYTQQNYSWTKMARAYYEEFLKLSDRVG